MTRLLFITTGLGTGGAERMLVKLLAALAGKPCSCQVVSLLDAGSQGKLIRGMGIPLAELHINRLGGLLAAPFRLIRIARRFKPNVIQGWMYHGNLAAVWAWLGVGRTARLIWGVRQTFYGMRRERPLTRAVIRAGVALSRLPAAIIFNSQASAAQHGSIGFRMARATVIANGFDLACFRPDAGLRVRMRAQLSISATSNAPVVGLVARYHPMKDHATFLAAAALIAKVIPEAVFVLAGSGVDAANAQITAQLQALGLSGATRLLGEVADPERLYPALDVLALTSAWGEAFPNVLGEAMACSVPCVATDVGEARNIVGDIGRIVPVAQPEALANEIIALLQLPAAQRVAIGERARARVDRLYSLDAVADAYWHCYSDGAPGPKQRSGAAVNGMAE